MWNWVDKMTTTVLLHSGRKTVTGLVSISATWEGAVGTKIWNHAIDPTLTPCENIKLIVILILTVVNFILYYRIAKVSGSQYKQQWLQFL
jgi:hypothetical protein